MWAPSHSLLLIFNFHLFACTMHNRSFVCGILLYIFFRHTFKRKLIEWDCIRFFRKGPQKDSGCHLDSFSTHIFIAAHATKLSLLLLARVEGRKNTKMDFPIKQLVILLIKSRNEHFWVRTNNRWHRFFSIEITFGM
jgi:hypothetical protein